MVSKSTDGGASWDVILPYSGVHPDHHALFIHPNDPNYLINGNDGGLNIAVTRGELDVRSLPVGKFYHIAVDNEEPYNATEACKTMARGSVLPCGTWAGFGTRIGRRCCLAMGLTCNRRAMARCMPCTKAGTQPRGPDDVGRHGHPMARPDTTPLRLRNAALALDPNDREGCILVSACALQPDRGSSWETLSLI